MNIRIAFRGMEHSVAIDSYARKQLAHLERFLKEGMEPLSIDLVLEAAKSHAHNRVELRFNGKNMHFIADEEGPDMYLVIEHVVKKMVSEVKKHKEKRLDKRNHPFAHGHKHNDIVEELPTEQKSEFEE